MAASLDSRIRRVAAYFESVSGGTGNVDVEARLVPLRMEHLQNASSFPRKWDKVTTFPNVFFYSPARIALSNLFQYVHETEIFSATGYPRATCVLWRTSVNEMGNL